jgi:hypothetical protein
MCVCVHLRDTGMAHLLVSYASLIARILCASLINVCVTTRGNGIVGPNGCNRPLWPLCSTAGVQLVLQPETVTESLPRPHGGVAV